MLADLGLGHCIIDAKLNAPQFALNFPRCRRCFFGQFAYLVGDHGKAATVFTGASRLDGRIQRQQIGLVGDFPDRCRDRLDLARAAGQFVDVGGEVTDRGIDPLESRQSLLHALMAEQRRLAAAPGKLDSRHRTAADALRRLGHAADQTDDLARVGAVRSQALAQSADQAVHLLGIAAHSARQVGDAADHVLHAGDHVAEGLGDGADHVLRLERAFDAKIAGTDLLGNVGHVAQGREQDDIHDHIREDPDRDAGDQAAEDEPRQHAGLPFDEKLGVEGKNGRHGDAKANE